MWCDLGESVGSRICNIFNFSIWLKSSLGEIHFAESPNRTIQSYSNWKILRTIENKRNAFLFLAVSHNQCCRLSTDPTRLQHIYRFSWLIKSILYQLHQHSITTNRVTLGSKEGRSAKWHHFTQTIYSLSGLHIPLILHMIALCSLHLPWSLPFVLATVFAFLPVVVSYRIKCNSVNSYLCTMPICRFWLSTGNVEYPMPQLFTEITEAQRHSHHRSGIRLK